MRQDIGDGCCQGGGGCVCVWRGERVTKIHREDLTEIQNTLMKKKKKKSGDICKQNFFFKKRGNDVGKTRGASL